MLQIDALPSKISGYANECNTRLSDIVDTHTVHSISVIHSLIDHSTWRFLSCCLFPGFYSLPFSSK